MIQGWWIGESGWLMSLCRAIRTFLKRTQKRPLTSDTSRHSRTPRPEQTPEACATFVTYWPRAYNVPSALPK
jgi:hypothetical protein